MSASLVGSEMCIRDRHWTTSSRTAPWCKSTEMARCWWCKLLVVAPFAPVSYTHLTLPTICSV
eukprot:4845203-Alexandrium_andersonii.AAC.1